MPQIPGGEDLVHQALAGYGLGRPVDAQVEAANGPWPVAYMQLGARAEPEVITTIGVFPKITRDQEALILNDLSLYDVRNFLADYMRAVRPPQGQGREHTEIDCAGLAETMRAERLVLAPQNLAYEIRDDLAVSGLKVIMDGTVRPLGPNEHLFEGELASWLA